MREQASEDKIREELRGNLYRSYRTPFTSVLRWNRSDNCIPRDIMLKMKRYGLVDQETVDATREAEQIDNAKFIAEYKVNRANRTQEEIAEEEFDIRAAFGPGETIVNVLTGERTRT